MFDIGASELLLIVIVAVVIIGPKDLPLALRTAGRWIAKVRRVSGHFRSGLDAMVREAELEELEREWKSRNEAIMKAHPETDPHPMPSAASAEAALDPTPQGEPQSPPPPP
jgi:sec-independent protein translocase protein TatB